MKKAISIAAIVLLGLLASPFALGLILLLLGAVIGVVAAAVGLLAVVISWLVPVVLCLGVVGGAFWLFTQLVD